MDGACGEIRATFWKQKVCIAWRDLIHFVLRIHRPCQQQKSAFAPPPCCSVQAKAVQGGDAVVALSPCSPSTNNWVTFLGGTTRRKIMLFIAPTRELAQPGHKVGLQQDRLQSVVPSAKQGGGVLYCCVSGGDTFFKIYVTRAAIFIFELTHLSIETRWPGARAHARRGCTRAHTHTHTHTHWPPARPHVCHS